MRTIGNRQSEELAIRRIGNEIIESLIKDIRYGVRMLTKNPAAQLKSIRWWRCDTNEGIT